MPNFYDLKALNDAKQAGADEIEQNNEPQFDYSRPLTNAERDNMFRNYTVNRQAAIDSVPDDIRSNYAADRIASRVPFDEWIEDPVNKTAHAQSDVGKVMNGIVKFFPYFGATVIDNTAGSVGALLHMGKDAVDGDGEFHASRSLIENPISKAMQDFRNWSDEVFPNKRTTEEMEDEDWWNHINANFIGDTFIKNLGFSAGAGAGGAVWAAAGRKALGSATRRAYRTAAASMLGEKNATDALQRIGRGEFLKSPKKAAALMNAVAGTRNKYAATSMLIGSVAGAGGEARMEALSVADELRAPLMQEAQERFDNERSKLAVSLINDPRYSDGKNLNADGMQLWIDGVTELKQNYKNEVDTINYEAGRAAVNTYYPNMAVLSLSNAIMFGKMFSGGYRTQGKSAVSGNMKEGFKPKTNAFHTAKDAMSLIKTPLSEGWEEMSQKIISDASSNYARHKMGDFHNKSYENKATKDIAEYIMNFGDSAKNTLSDKMSWQEFAVGALTGALGMAGTPTYNNKTKSLDFSSMFKNWNGGIYGAVKDIKERRKYSRDMAEKLNARIDDPDFKEYYKGLVRHTNLEYEKQQALQNKDKYIWQNKDFEQLLSDIIMFDKVGRLEEFKDTVASFADISREDAQKIAELFDSDGQFDEAKLKELQKKFNKQAKKVYYMIDDYSAMYNAIDYLSLGTSDPIVIEELMYTGMQLKNFEYRYKNLAKNVVDRIVPVLEAEAARVDKNGNPTDSAQLANLLLADKDKIVTLFGSDIDQSRSPNSIYDFFMAAQDKERSDSVMEWLSDIGALDVDAQMKNDITDLQRLIKSRNNFYNTLFDPTFRYKAAPRKSDSSTEDGSDASDTPQDEGGDNGRNPGGSAGSTIIYDEDGNPIVLDGEQDSDDGGDGGSSSTDGGSSSSTDGSSSSTDDGSSSSTDGSSSSTDSSSSSTDSGSSSSTDGGSSSTDGSSSSTDGSSSSTEGGSSSTEGGSSSSTEGGSSSSDDSKDGGDADTESPLDGLDDEAKKRVTDAIDKLSKAKTLGDFANVHYEVARTLKGKAESDAFNALISKDAALKAKYDAVMAISKQISEILKAVNKRNNIGVDMFLNAIDRKNNYKGVFNYCEGKKNINRAICDYAYTHLPREKGSVDVQNAVIDALNEYLGKDVYKLRGDNSKPLTDEEAAESRVKEEREKKINEAFERLKNASSLIEFNNAINDIFDTFDLNTEEVKKRLKGNKAAQKRYRNWYLPIDILDSIYIELAEEEDSQDRTLAINIISQIIAEDINEIYKAYDDEVRNGNPNPNIKDITYNYIASQFPMDDMYTNAYNMVGAIANKMANAERLSSRAGKVDDREEKTDQTDVPSDQTDTPPDTKNHIYIECKDERGNKYRIDIAGNTRYRDYIPKNGVDRDYAAKYIADINKITSLDSVLLANLKSINWIINNVDPHISKRDADSIISAAIDRSKAIADYNNENLLSLDDGKRKEAIDEYEARMAKERSEEFRKRDVFCINCDKYPQYDADDLQNENTATTNKSSNPRVISILEWKRKHNVQNVVDSGFLHDIGAAKRDKDGNYLNEDICFLANPHLSATNPFAKEYEDKNNSFNGRSCEIVLAVDVTDRFNGRYDKYVSNGIITNDTVIEINGRKYQPIGIMKSPYISGNSNLSEDIKTLYSENAKQLANIVYDVVITGAKGSSDEGSIMKQYMDDVAAKAPIPEDGKWYVARKNKSASLDKDGGDVIHTGFGYIMPGRRMRGDKLHSLRDVINGVVYGNPLGGGNGKYVDEFKLGIQKRGQGTTLHSGFRDGAIGIEFTEPNGTKDVWYVTVPTFGEFDFKLNDNTKIVNKIKEQFEIIANPKSTSAEKLRALTELHGMIWCHDSPLQVSGNSVIVNNMTCNTIDEFISACAASQFKFNVTDSNINDMYESNVLLTDMRTFVNKGASFAITGLNKSDASPIRFRVEKSIAFAPGSGSIGTEDKRVVFGEHNYGIDEDGMVYRIDAGDHVYDITPKERHTALAVAYINGEALDNVEGHTCPFRTDSDKRATHWLVKMKVGGDIIRLHIRETGLEKTDKDGNVTAPGRRTTFVVSSESEWNALVNAAKEAGNTWTDEVMRANNYDDFFFEGYEEYDSYGKGQDSDFLDNSIKEEIEAQNKQEEEDKKKKEYEEAVASMKDVVTRAGEEKADAQSRIEDIYKRYVDMELDIEDMNRVIDELHISEAEYDELCKYLISKDSEEQEKDNRNGRRRRMEEEDDLFC